MLLHFILCVALHCVCMQGEDPTPGGHQAEAGADSTEEGGNRGEVCVSVCVWEGGGRGRVVGTNCMKTLPPTSPSQSLQSEVEVGTKQREELEREKLDVQGKLDLLDSEVYILAGYMVETSLLEFVMCLVAESQV